MKSIDCDDEALQCVGIVSVIFNSLLSEYVLNISVKMTVIGIQRYKLWNITHCKLLSRTRWWHLQCSQQISLQNNGKLHTVTAHQLGVWESPKCWPMSTSRFLGPQADFLCFCSKCMVFIDFYAKNLFFGMVFVLKPAKSQSCWKTHSAHPSRPIWDFRGPAHLSRALIGRLRSAGGQLDMKWLRLATTTQLLHRTLWNFQKVDWNKVREKQVERYIISKLVGLWKCLEFQDCIIF